MRRAFIMISAALLVPIAASGLAVAKPDKPENQELPLAVAFPEVVRLDRHSLPVLRNLRSDELP
jgi:hypothetical protein